MATHLATIDFGDGRRLYTYYSTVVGALHEDLYAGFGPRSPQDSRPGPVGEPEPADPQAPASPPGELVPVRISELDGSWHALYCPRRGLVVGPESGHHHRTLAFWYELVDGADGLRHLRYHLHAFSDAPTAPCGQPVPGAGTALTADDDLFADWRDPRLCRACLLTQLPAVVEFPDPPAAAG